MIKKVFGRKLSRAQGSRRALFRSLVRALVLYGQIKTTKAKAKAVQGQIDKLMKFVAKGDVAARRLVLAKLGNDRETVEQLFSQFKEIVKARKSGFTRIIRLPARRGDQAPLARLEWVDKPEAKAEEKKIEEKKKAVKKGKNENLSTKTKRS